MNNDDDNDNANNKGSTRKDVFPIKQLDVNLLAVIVSFCDVADYLALLEISSSAFSSPTSTTVVPFDVAIQSALSSMHTTWNFSFLQQKYSNNLLWHTANPDYQKSQTSAIIKILDLFSNKSESNNDDIDDDDDTASNTNEISNTTSTKTKTIATTTIITSQCSHVEFCNLYNITGWDHHDVGWIQQLAYSCPHLVSLNFSGCTNLAPTALREFLLACRPTLRHLFLLNCRRIETSVVYAIATKHMAQLVTLWLGGCSQQIRDASIRLLLLQQDGTLRLKHLDLQNLNSITGTHHHRGGVGGDDDTNAFLKLLPSTIESINLSGCSRLQIGNNFPELNVLKRLFRDNPHNSTIMATATTRTRTQNNNNRSSRSSLQSTTTAASSANNSMLPFPIVHNQLTHINMDGLGSPRRGLHCGMLAYFALGGKLQEVALAGCEQIEDWEVVILARHCSRSLRSFQMSATEIGDASLMALATYCPNLMSCDVSACFRVSNEGVLALCNAQFVQPNEQDDNSNDRNDAKKNNCNGKKQARSESNITTTTTQRSQKRRTVSSRLRVLNLANLSNLTNDVLSGISNLTRLHILDVEDCVNLTTTALCRTILTLPQLIEVNGRGIAEGEGGRSLPVQLRAAMVAEVNRDAADNQNAGSTVPIGLRIVNRRTFVRWNTMTSATQTANTALSKHNTLAATDSTSCNHKACCSVRKYSQRLTVSVPLNIMIHCYDCQLLPEYDRGVCSTCASICHKGHRTFVGCYTRYYCDCPFDIVPPNRICKAIFPDETCKVIFSEDEDDV